MHVHDIVANLSGIVLGQCDCDHVGLSLWWHIVVCFQVPCNQFSSVSSLNGSCIKLYCSTLHDPCISIGSVPGGSTGVDIADTTRDSMH